MTIALIVRRLRTDRRTGKLLIAGLLSLGAVMPARAQYVRIPDIRNSPPPVAVPRAGEVCENCGVIRSIREIQDQRSISTPRTFQNEQIDQGGPSAIRVGAVVALPMGNNPNNEQAFVGGVGTPEMRARFSQSTYEITIRLDNGASSTVQRRDGGSFRVGDRVRLRGIELELITL